MRPVYAFLGRGLALSMLVLLLLTVAMAAYSDYGKDFLLREPTLGYLAFSMLPLAAFAALSHHLTVGLITRLNAAAQLDQPNDRSMHKVPVPRGGGWSFVLPVATTLVFYIGIEGYISDLELDWRFCGSHDSCWFPRIIWLPLSLLSGVILLAWISWRDDRQSVAARWRLLAQCTAVSITMLVQFYQKHDTTPVNLMEYLAPGWGWVGGVIFISIALLWVAFINFYNFMDGIDGITTTETISIAAFIPLLIGLSPSAFSGDSQDLAFVISFILLGSSLGFLRHNWHPAKIFLGDVGSVTIGYLLGFCLLSLAADGYWAIALTLPLYYLADAGLTLLRRLFAGEKIWQAHRSHFYQRAAMAAGRHDVVVKKIALCNLALLAIATASLYTSAWLCALAPLPVALLLHQLHSMAQQRHNAPPQQG